jgi:hypothetical protein
LFLENGNDLSPSCPKTMRSWWKVVLDGFVERREIVEWHWREHVVLDVILHVPIKEPNERAAGVGAAAEPEIRRVGHHSDVLGKARELAEPTCITDATDQEHSGRELLTLNSERCCALVGGPALNAFANLQFDFALIGATGLNSEGCWTTEFTETEIKKYIIARAKSRIVLADQSKWQAPGTVLFSRWDDINDWVVDQLPKDATQALPQSTSVHRQMS